MMADGLAQIRGIRINPEKVVTNILVFDISGIGMNTSDFSRKLAERGVLAAGINAEQMRFVTHMDVSREECTAALTEIRRIITA
jgi:threonine aldolase